MDEYKNFDAEVEPLVKFAGTGERSISPPPETRPSDKVHFEESRFHVLLTSI